ncbi:hypothetical protein JOC85_002218 [Bacillus mesophilus]|nr:hypothetical protein [Bacillus mesophilus]MBM7661415.1 hypothetical protein [Bacillus mesophilus]
MDEKQNLQQPPDTGKLTNYHYASEQDKRTDKIEQEAQKRQK